MYLVKFSCLDDIFQLPEERQTFSCYFGYYWKYLCVGNNSLHAYDKIECSSTRIFVH